MNRLPLAKRVQIIRAIVEGSSLRSTSRMADVSINTVTKLLSDVGKACATYHDAHVRNVASKRIQCDEIWSFCYAKRKNVTQKIAEAHPDAGDLWTWTGIDADSKLIVSWFVGDRGVNSARAFASDLSSRLKNRVQITTDAFRPYLGAIDEAFAEVDYAQLHKVYQLAVNEVNRYSPPAVIGTSTKTIRGNPDPTHISTSFIERTNLTIRMSNRRFTRLTNGFSKKAENHVYALALQFVYFNFARVHHTLRVTPAMEAGLADHVWSIEEIALLT